MLRSKRFCLVLSFLAWGVSTYAKQKDCKKQIVTVSARDKHDNFVSGLQTSDFQAKVRGKGVDIVSAAPGTAPRVAVVLDTSGGMAFKWKHLQDVSSALLRFSPEDVQFSLIVFGGRVLEKIEFGHSRQEILSAINQFALNQPSWMRVGEEKRMVRDSLLDAYDLLHPAQVGDSILVATDERDNDSKVSEKALGDRFRSEGIRFLVMRFGDDPYSRDKTLVHNELELLSAATGGTEINIESTRQSQIAAQNMAAEIAQYYLIQIALPEPLVKDSSLQIEVINSARQKRKDVELTFPEKLPACTELSAH
jgi:hypothetical protein